MNPNTWQEGNSRYLTVSLKWLRLRLEQLARQSGAAPEPPPVTPPPPPPQMHTPRGKSSRWPHWFGSAAAEGAVAGAAEPLLLPVPNFDELLKQAAAEREEAAKMEPPPALFVLGQQLGLSDFEREVLMLCVAT